MDTQNYTASQAGCSPAENSYEGLSREEIGRLQGMAPELRDALLRLRRNIHIRQQEREQETEARELNRMLIMGIPRLSDSAIRSILLVTVSMASTM